MQILLLDLLYSLPFSSLGVQTIQPILYYLFPLLVTFLKYYSCNTSMGKEFLDLDTETGNEPVKCFSSSGWGGGAVSVFWFDCGLGNVKLKVGLGDLRGLFQP